MADAFSKPLPACHCFPPTALAVNCRADKGHAYTDDELTDLEFSDKNLNLHLIMGIEGCTLPMPPPPSRNNDDYSPLNMAGYFLG